MSTKLKFYCFAWFAKTRPENNKKSLKNRYGTNSKHVIVTVLAKPVHPVAAFFASPTTGKAPLTVNFTDQSTNSPTSWHWDFGGKRLIGRIPVELTSTLQNPQAIYNAAGKYTVTLTATNAAGSNTTRKLSYIVV